MELAILFKEPRVARLQEILNGQEFTEWDAYLTLYPQGSVVEDTRFAMLAALLAANAGSKFTALKDWRARDLMSLLDVEEKPRTAADLRRELEQTRLAMRALFKSAIEKKAKTKPKGKAKGE